MGRALMARLLGGEGHGDYVAPVELVERASLQAPRATYVLGHYPAWARHTGPGPAA